MTTCVLVLGCVAAILAFLMIERFVTECEHRAIAETNQRILEERRRLSDPTIAVQVYASAAMDWRFR